MSILQKVLSEVQASEVIENAAEAAKAEQKKQKQRRIAARFAEVGVSAFMQRQMLELRANRFAATANHNYDERGVASLDFVATQDEAFDDGGPSWGLMNAYTFLVRTWGADDVSWSCSRSRRSGQQVNGEFKLEELSIAKLEELFEQSLRFALTTEKENKAEASRYHY